MKALADPHGLLGAGLAAIRQQFAVPGEFPPPVLAEARQAALRQPDEHADWTDRAFITLDPAHSTDLDQAFLLEQAGADLLLHYALADVGWFVPAGSALEAEAWRRGVTLYLPDGRARLYPAALSEGAASLLPDGPRPAIVASVRCTKDSDVALTGVTRALVHSRAKLGYETTEPGDIPLLSEFAERMRRGQDARGAATASAPDQELERDASGAYSLHVRAWRPSEVANSALSLAANIAIAQALHAAGTGMFREMAPPDDAAVRRLRVTARALGLTWPDNATFAQFNRTVDPRTRAGATFAQGVRRATGHATYVPYTAGRVPWHAALGATYTHATAPMRRLADRYVLDAVLALARGHVPAEGDAALFARLCPAMDAADAREGAIERAVLDLAEAVMLAGREGETFAATVIQQDERGARIQLDDLPILSRVDAPGGAAGEALMVRLLTADPQRRELRFELVS